jgi:hypothetical protein
MPTPKQIASIYDFERVMELALKGLFTDNEVKAFTSQMIVGTGDRSGCRASSAGLGFD